MNKLFPLTMSLLLAGGAVRAEAPPADGNRKPATVDFDTCEKPVWPRASLEKEETGTVHLSFLIGADGAVKDATLLASSGAPLLDQAAIEGVGKCRFNPATIDGKPVEGWQKMQYVWSLEVASPEEEAAMEALRSGDVEGAAALFRKAALKGSVDAQYYLGRMYYFGSGVPQDADEGGAWLEKAAARGHVQAQGTLGAVLLARGNADTRAFDLIRRAARSGDGASMYWLGLCLAYGRGTAQDIPQALRWYERAATHGHAKARQALADLERQGIKPPR